MSYLHPSAEHTNYSQDLEIMNEVIDGLQAQQPDESRTLKEHQALATHIGIARQKILGDYQFNLPLLAEHVDAPGTEDAAALLVHASTPRTLRNLNWTSTEQELLGARITAMRGVLRAVLTAEIGDPFSFELGNKKRTSHEITGKAVERPRLLTESRYDALALSTPFVGTPDSRLYADGIIELHNLAMRDVDSEHSILPYTITVGAEAMGNTFAQALSQARKTEEHAFGVLRDTFKGEHALDFVTSLSAEDGEWVEDKVCHTYASEPRGALESHESLGAILRLGDTNEGLVKRIATTKELIVQYAAEEVADVTSIRNFSFTCEEAARKVMALDQLAELPQTATMQEINALQSGYGDSPELLAAYKNIVAGINQLGQ